MDSKGLTLYHYNRTFIIEATELSSNSCTKAPFHWMIHLSSIVDRSKQSVIQTEKITQLGRFESVRFDWGRLASVQKTNTDFRAPLCRKYSTSSTETSTKWLFNYWIFGHYVNSPTDILSPASWDIYCPPLTFPGNGTPLWGVRGACLLVRA